MTLAELGPRATMEIESYTALEAELRSYRARLN